MSYLPPNGLLSLQSMNDIMYKASDVFIIQEDIIQMAQRVITYLDNVFQNEEYEKVTSKFTRYFIDLYPDYNDCRVANWIFVLHTLNFLLWSPKGTDPWTVNGYTGFLALCATMKRVIPKLTRGKVLLMNIESLNGRELATRADLTKIILTNLVCIVEKIAFSVVCKEVPAFYRMWTDLRRSDNRSYSGSKVILLILNGFSWKKVASFLQSVNSAATGYNYMRNIYNKYLNLILLENNPAFIKDTH